MRFKTSILAVGVLAFSTLTSIVPATAVALDGVGVSTNGLQFFYDVNNPAGIDVNTLKDLSGNNRDAAVTQVSSQPVKSTSNGGHLSFNGSGGYATVGAYSFPTYTGITVSFYANFGTSAGTFERIIDFGNRDANNNLEIGRIGTGSDFFAEAWTGTYSPGWCRANGSIDSNWHFWVVTIGGGYCNIYKDNVQVTTNFAYNSLPTADTWNKMYIGKSNWADAAFEGGIAELAFYNRVIDSNERAQNYNAALDQTSPILNGGANSANENQNLATQITFDQVGTTLSIVGGVDSDKLSINSSGYVYFTANPNLPNYENPSDSGGNRRYDFVVRAIDPNGNYTDYTTYVTISNVNENATLTIPVVSANPTKGIAVTITVTPGGDNPIPSGKVTYMMAGKRIAGCYKKTYSGSGNSTCSWKPTAQGYREITVIYKPTDNTYSEVTSKKTFWVYKRATTR